MLKDGELFQASYMVGDYFLRNFFVGNSYEDVLEYLTAIGATNITIANLPYIDLTGNE